MYGKSHSHSPHASGPVAWAHGQWQEPPGITAGEEVQLGGLGLQTAHQTDSSLGIHTSNLHETISGQRNDE